MNREGNQQLQHQQLLLEVSHPKNQSCMILLNSPTIWSNDYSSWHRCWLPIICPSTDFLFLVVVFPQGEQTSSYATLAFVAPHCTVPTTLHGRGGICGILTFIACTTASGFWPTGTYPAAGEDARSVVRRAGPCWNKWRNTLIPFGWFKQGGRNYSENFSTSISQFQPSSATCKDRRYHYVLLTSH